MRYTRLLVFLLICLVPLSAYGRSREEARIILGQMNVPYTSEEFLSHAVQGDDVVLKLFLEAGMDVNAKDNDGMTLQCIHSVLSIFRLTDLENFSSKLFNMIATHRSCHQEFAFLKLK